MLLLVVCIGAPGSAIAAERTILVLGDSLSAGYGIKAAEGWTSLLQQRLASEGYGYRVVNASVSGETTSGGETRLPRALSLNSPAVVIIELGANDALRGLPLDVSRKALRSMVEASRAAGAEVLLLGMRIPPNYGARYAREFEQVFTELSTQEKVTLVPFFLEKIALDDRNFQADGLHPTAAAQPKLLATVWPTLKPMLRK